MRDDGPAAEHAGEQAQRYCRWCQYDLAGLSALSCPECGRAYSPDDPSTTLNRPVPAWQRAVVSRYGVMAGVALLVISGFVHTVLPRPVSITDPGLWVWLDKRYGVSNRAVGNGGIRAWYWADLAYEVVGYERGSEAIRWRFRRVNEDDWSLRVYHTGVPWRDLLWAFNEMKHELFGVVFTRWEIDASTEPFEALGTAPEVLTALVRHFGVRVQTVRMRTDQPYVWVFDPERERMEPVPVTPDNEDGFPLRFMGAERPLVARPAPEARLVR